MFGRISTSMSSESEPRDIAEKQIRISFHRPGHLQLPQKESKEDVEKFLLSVWEQFGAVTSVYYRKEFSYGIVTFRDHIRATFAFDGLNDPIQVQAAVQSVVGADTALYALAKQLFMYDAAGVSVSATWVARTLRSRSNDTMG